MIYLLAVQAFMLWFTFKVRFFCGLAVASSLVEDWCLRRVSGIRTEAGYE